MRLKLILHRESGKELPINYQYPFSAVIYKIIQKADGQFATFLHEEGYRYQGRSFKLFTFSDISTPFIIKNDRLILKDDTAEILVCFHMPDAAANFVKGLFIDQRLEIADQKSKVRFRVHQVTVEQPWQESLPIKDGTAEVLLQAISPIVAGRREKKDDHYQYLGPLDEGFTDCLIYNLLGKYQSINDQSEEEVQQLKKQINMEIVFSARLSRQRLIWIKAGTAEETKIKGFDKFRIKMRAPVPLIKLGLNSGYGLNNSQGMGCVQVVEK